MRDWAVHVKVSQQNAHHQHTPYLSSLIHHCIIKALYNVRQKVHKFWWNSLNWPKWAKKWATLFAFFMLKSTPPPMLVVLTNMSCDHLLWWSLTFSLDCNEEAIILKLVYLHIASAFRSTDPFSSTGDDHKNYRIYRHADDWNHSPFQNFSSKN